MQSLTIPMNMGIHFIPYEMIDKNSMVFKGSWISDDYPNIHYFKLWE